MRVRGENRLFGPFEPINEYLRNNDTLQNTTSVLKSAVSEISTSAKISQTVQNTLKSQYNTSSQTGSNLLDFRD